MAGATTRGYPYPTSSDANDVPYAMQTALEAVDDDVAALYVHTWESSANLTLNGSLYASFGAGGRNYQPTASVHARPNGTTFLRGLVTNNTTLTLTAGTEYQLTSTAMASQYRPTSSLIIPAISSHGPVRLVIENTGHIFYVSESGVTSAAAGAWYIALDSARWDAA